MIRPASSDIAEHFDRQLLSGDNVPKPELPDRTEAQENAGPDAGCHIVLAQPVPPRAIGAALWTDLELYLSV